MPTTHHPLGIDIGGSGIKGAPVDLAKGQFAKDRQRYENTKLSSPGAVVDIVVQIAEHFADDTGDSPIGVTLPAVVTDGVVRTAANIDSAWIGTDGRKLLSEVKDMRANGINWPAEPCGPPPPFSQYFCRKLKRVRSSLP